MHINHTIKTISAFRFFIRESVPLQKLYILVRSAAKVYLYKNCKYWCGLLHTKSVCVCVCMDVGVHAMCTIQVNVFTAETARWVVMPQVKVVLGKEG